MELYTVQLGQWRKVRKLEVELIDTTTKSGNPAFAPGWDIVLPYKAGEITEAQYTAIYMERMALSRVQNTADWDAVVALDRAAIACFCRAGKFCHRHLLIPLFINHGAAQGVTCELKGEIT